MLDKLIKISNQLLDLGKRNRLLNYRDTGFKTLNILNKSIDVIFRGLTNGKEFNVFNTDLAFTNYRKDLGVKLEEENTQAYSNEKVFEILNKSLEATDILCFKQNSTLEKVLKSLVKEYNTSLIEKGINALYMSFGFIEYKEEEDSYLAPLLLIPIELSVENGKYTICEYEDEVLVNPTLAYYFDVMYSIKLTEYKNEALATYFTKILEILPENVTLHQRASIGIYSFYKMNMYNDLIQNKNIVIKNKNIQYLLDGSKHIEDSKVNNPIYPVVNFDSSQLEAIQFAANGLSFCLQGPPGSGKSQTITNIIATLLGSGKKILFVSEKIAALKVVYENLRRSGLNDFALELHSNKTNKKEFIESIYNASILPKYNMDFKTRAVVAKYDNLVSNLGRYEYELHGVVPALGKSLLDLYAEYLAIDIKPTKIEVNVENMNLFDLSQTEEILTKYEENTLRLGYDYRQSFFHGLNTSNFTYLISGFDSDLDVSINHLAKLRFLANLMNNDIHLNINTVDDAYDNLDLLNRVSHLQYYKPAYFKATVRNKLYYMLEDYIKIKSSNSDILNFYNEDILNEDIEVLLFKYKNSLNGSKLFNKELKECNNTIFKYRSDKEKPEQIIKELSLLLALKNDYALAKKYEANFEKYIGKYDIEGYKLVIRDMKLLANLKDLEISAEEFVHLKKELKANQISLKQLVEEKPTFDRVADLLTNPDYNIKKDNLEAVYSKLDGLYKDKALIFAYVENEKGFKYLREHDNLSYLNQYLDKKLPIENLTKNFSKLFYLTHIEQIISSSTILSKFNSQNEEEMVETFIELDENILKVNRDTIISNNSQRRPDKDIIVEGSEFKLLNREHEKTRKQMPIRQLLDQIFNLALDVKPVFLMSPLSVSTYLNSELEMFDCVIFDEASQIFASDALGSIYRGKQCIVIGDTKQMPPTSFFQAEFGFEEDSDEYDMESILDKATTVFRTLSLKWHYRSRSEELINFSNQRFYDSNLITIPQAKTHEKGFGIDFAFVNEGLYDAQSRTNPNEAAFVCDLVFDHVKNSNESIGVVAFSNVQAELISDLVEKRLKKQPEYQKYFDKYDDEPFFVKNLESVQGDERDRIIFSICYGYNKEGKFYQRFGPLNTSGGERRLNVAITRAKFNITVVSSIHYSDIVTKNTNSLGVLLLRDYLQFSENVMLEKNYKDTDNGLINSVIEFVNSLGFEAHANYGSSSFKVDIAVKKGNEFFFAIMIDGKDYSDSLTDKYRLEKLLLERLGWNYFKLFSTSWLNNMEEEKERLKDALLEEKSNEEVITKKEKKHTFLKVDKGEASIDSYFVEYQELIPDLAKKYLASYDLEYLIKKILHKESPIHKEQLYKRIVTITEGKMTQQLKDEVDAAIPVEAYIENDFLFENRYMDIKLRYQSKLPPAYIHINEYVDGIYTIVSKNNGISVDDCYRTVAQTIGYDKLTPNLKKYMEQAFEILRQNRKLNNIDGYLYLYV